MSPLLLLTAALAATTAIENVRVETGGGEVLERATILFADGRITALGAGVIAPSDARRIDATGKTVTPGFIEAISQLGVTEVDLEESTNDYVVEGEALTPGFRVADGFNPLSVRIPINREEGITSVVVSPRGGLLYGLAYWVDMLGTLSSRPDPTRPVAMFGGVGTRAASAAGGARGNAWMMLRQALDDARHHRRAGPQRELSLSTLHLEALYPVMDGKQLLVLEAQRASDILAALELARSEKLLLAISGAAEAWMVASTLAASKTAVIITPTQQLPRSFETLGARDDSPALLERAGVTVILSTDDGDQNVRRLRQQAGQAVAYGMSRAGALRAVTLSPAELFGQAKELGSIAVGKRADLVIWSGDPFELSTVAERLWIKGVEMSLDNRQRRLAERYSR